MRNILGNNLTLTLFGESHGEKIGCVIDGLCAGVKINYENIKNDLSKRRPQSTTETARVEADNFNIVSGVFNGFSTGEPICILIDNTNVKSSDYEDIKNLARPSHVDFSVYEKHHGFNDYRGGGHYSGRITAPIVAAGSIIKDALKLKGITINSHILKCGRAEDKSFDNCENDVEILNKKDYPTILDIKDKIENEIINAKNNNDSIGGIIETCVLGLKPGLGEPWFSSVEGMLSLGLFGIGGIKGVEFGKGFEFANLTGSTANDELENVNNNIVTKSNNNGGINGGITNGMPVIFRCAVKPTPSISKEQNTINLVTKENEIIKIKGRHDPSIIRRVLPVIDAITAFVIADLLVTKEGTDTFRKQE